MVASHARDPIGRSGADGSAVPDSVAARKVYDSAEQASANLLELVSIGVDPFNAYLMAHGQEQTLTACGREILPACATRR